MAMDDETKADYKEAFAEAKTPLEALILVRDFMEPCDLSGRSPSHPAVQGTEDTNLAMHDMIERVIKNAERTRDAE